MKFNKDDYIRIDNYDQIKEGDVLYHHMEKWELEVKNHLGVLRVFHEDTSSFVPVRHYCALHMSAYKGGNVVVKGDDLSSFHDTPYVFKSPVYSNSVVHNNVDVDRRDFIDLGEEYYTVSNKRVKILSVDNYVFGKIVCDKRGPILIAYPNSLEVYDSVHFPGENLSILA